ncbi:MAG: hypothetical protein H0W83_00170 [Planctomycetes bacterium]|nr:hypothetical protein [Planctomycetota bacterium]
MSQNFYVLDQNAGEFISVGRIGAFGVNAVKSDVKTIRAILLFVATHDSNSILITHEDYQYDTALTKGRDLTDDFVRKFGDVVEGKPIADLGVNQILERKVTGVIAQGAGSIFKFGNGRRLSLEQVVQSKPDLLGFSTAILKHPAVGLKIS